MSAAPPLMLPNVPFKDYLADTFHDQGPTLASGVAAKLLITAPAEVWEGSQNLNPDFEPKTADVFDLGNAAHSLFLGAGQNLTVVDADSWRTKEAKEIKSDAHATGNTPILRKDYERAKAMADAAKRDFSGHPDLGPILKDFMPEATMLWREAGVTCRSRPDIYSRELHAIIHYKTTGTSVHDTAVERWAVNSGAAFTLAHYKAGGVAMNGHTPRQFFALQSTAKPHITNVVEMSDAWVAGAEMVRARALSIWGRCMASGKWPRQVGTTVHVEMPEWEENNMIRIKDSAERRLNPSTETLARVTAWQGPA